MARSGSVNFTLSRDEVILSAYELVQVAVSGEPLSNEDLQVAARALNVMIKAWQGHGLQLWKRSNITIPLTASTATYTIGRAGGQVVTEDRPLRILNAVRVDSSSNRVPMSFLAYDEYEALPNLTQSGPPVQYSFSPTLDNSTVYVWPVPTAADATEYNIILTVQSPLNDMDDGLNDFDFPQEWLEAVIYGLAVRLAPRTGLSVQERSMLRAEAKEMLELALGFDIEQGSVYFQKGD